MPMKCPSGTTPSCRHKTTKKNKVTLKLCGCMKKGKFIKNGVKDVKKVKKK